MSINYEYLRKTITMDHKFLSKLERFREKIVQLKPELRTMNAFLLYLLEQGMTAIDNNIAKAVDNGE